MFCEYQSIYLSVKDIITFILTVVGLVIAGIGLDTWKKQIKGGKEFKVFYKLNYYLLQLRNAIKHVRNPAIWNAEIYKAVQHFKKEYPEKQEEDIIKNSNVYVYELRWKKIADAFTKMESYFLAAEVLWGSEILEKIKPLKRKVNELNISLAHYLDPEITAKKRQELFNIIYDQSNENKEDNFNQEVNKSIKDISDYLKEKFK